jgi:hypothetical protein
MTRRSIAPLVRLMEWESITADQTYRLRLDEQAHAIEARDISEGRLGFIQRRIESVLNHSQLSVDEYRLHEQQLAGGLSTLWQRQAVVDDVTQRTEQSREAAIQAQHRLEVLRKVQDRRAAETHRAEQKRAETETNELWLSRRSPTA